MLVTLEPCAHTGRTGPCTDAVLAAGVARVVYAVADPTPRAGGGADVLRAAGVQVEAGLLAEEAEQANERWLTRLNGWIEQARRFEGQPMSPPTARALSLLKLMTAMPAPRNPEKLAELAGIASKMEGMYGSGAYCTGEGEAKRCRQLGELAVLEPAPRSASV